MSPSRDFDDRLAAAKLWLVSAGTGDEAGPRDLPYLAQALYALIAVPSTSVSGLTGDENWRVYVNPTWLTETPIARVAAEVAHVTWHLLRDHANRARDLRVTARSAAQWHEACDMALEPTLRADGLADVAMPCASARGLPANRPAEEYYASISGLPVVVGDGEPDEIGCGSCCDGLTRSFEFPPGADIGEVDEHAARNIRRAVAIAYREQATGRGDTPGDAWRWIKDVLEPTVPWEPLLASAVRRAVAWTNGHTEYTYSRPSRRQSAVPKVVLPGMCRPVPNAALIVDTSSSVDDTLLGRALGEVDGALRGLGVSGASVTVLACDAAVQTVARVRTSRDAKLAGGGGTDMRAGLRAAVELRPKPDVVVVFTDGFTPWPEHRPTGAAVIAAILGREGHALPPTPPWARRIECLC